MDTAGSAEVIVEAIRESLGHSHAVSRGFRLDGVWPERCELVVSFRWWQDPNRYAVRFPFPDGTSPESPWTGLPVDSVQEWAHDVAGLLAEELDTGAVRRAWRRRKHGIVELDWHDARSSCPPGYCCSAVVLPSALGRWSAVPGLFADFGRSLTRSGLDVAIPRARHQSGRLLSWLQLSTDDSSPEPVGHVSVAWHPTLPTTATLDVLQLLPATPDAAAPYLARMAVHDAAEAGALLVQASCSHPQLAQAGFRQERPYGPATVDTTALG